MSKASNHTPAIFWPAMGRALRLRCPRCGKGPLLKSWFSHWPRCSVCDLIYSPDPIDLGMFMYLSTAMITGLFVLAYLWIGFPTDHWARFGVALAGLGLMLLTDPLRRCIGIAVFYVFDEMTKPEDPTLGKK